MKVSEYASRRPLTSDIGPQRLGASPWKIRYEVTVRLINSIETSRSWAMVGRAGK
jgi:hypothetical protein